MLDQLHDKPAKEKALERMNFDYNLRKAYIYNWVYLPLWRMVNANTSDGGAPIRDRTGKQCRVQRRVDGKVLCIYRYQVNWTLYSEMVEFMLRHAGYSKMSSNLMLSYLRPIVTIMQHNQHAVPLQPGET